MALHTERAVGRVKGGGAWAKPALGKRSDNNGHRSLGRLDERASARFGCTVEKLIGRASHASVGRKSRLLRAVALVFVVGVAQTGLAQPPDCGLVPASCYNGCLAYQRCFDEGGGGCSNQVATLQSCVANNDATFLPACGIGVSGFCFCPNGATVPDQQLCDLGGTSGSGGGEGAAVVPEYDPVDDFLSRFQLGID